MSDVVAAAEAGAEGDDAVPATLVTRSEVELAVELPTVVSAPVLVPAVVPAFIASLTAALTFGPAAPVAAAAAACTPRAVAVQITRLLYIASATVMVELAV